MKSGRRQDCRVLAVILVLVTCVASLTGCSSTGSKTPEALVKRAMHAAITLDGEDLMDCILPELSSVYRMAVQFSASMTGQNPEKALAEEYYRVLADTYELDGVDPKDISEQTIIISKEQDDLTATVRALVILQIGKQYDYTEYYVACSCIKDRWYFSNMFTSQPYGYTPTKVMLDDDSLRKKMNELDQKRLAVKTNPSAAEQRDMIMSAAIKREVDSLAGKLIAIYEYEGDDELTAFERQGYMGLIDSITDAFSVLASVEAGGLIRGQDIVHDIAFEIMCADLSKLSEKMDMLTALTAALSTGKSMANATMKASHEESVMKILEAAEQSPNAYQFIQTICNDNDLYDAYEQIRSGKVFMGFSNMTELFDYAQFMRRLELGVSTTNTLVSLTNRITDYELAARFADLYVSDLKRLRDTTHSERLYYDLNTFIQSVEGGLAERIKAYIDVQNVGDGAKIVCDGVKATFELSKNGFFGESLQGLARSVANSEVFAHAVGGLQVASAVADSPSFVMGIFGYDTEEIAKSMDEMNSILPIYRNELDILGDYGPVTNANYRKFEDQYYLCLILGKAWCKSYLSSCNASMNHLEKIGLWSESDVRKAAKNIESFIVALDTALDNIDAEHLEAFVSLCSDTTWEVQY